MNIAGTKKNHSKRRTDNHNFALTFGNKLNVKFSTSKKI